MAITGIGPRVIGLLAATNKPVWATEARQAESFFEALDRGNVAFRIGDPNFALVKSGVIAPEYLSALGINELVFFSGVARRNPEALAVTLNGLSEATDPSRAYVEICLAADKGLVGFRDAEVPENPRGFSPDLRAQIIATDADFAVEREILQDPKTNQYVLIGRDNLLGKKVPIEIEVIHSVYEGKKIITAKATFVYDSPVLAAKLSHLFQTNWLYKQRSRMIKIHTAQQVSYVWGFFMHHNYVAGMEAELSFALRDPDSVLTAIRMPPEYKNPVLTNYIMDQLMLSLSGLPPHLSMAKTGLQWDLGRVRVQLLG